VAETRPVLTGAPAPAAAPIQTQLQQAVQAVSVAIQSAAIRQGGLADLMADLVQAMGSTGLPGAAQAAADRVLAARLPLASTPTPADLKAAVAQSGVFLEANLASGQSPGLDMKAALLVLGRALAAWSEEEPPPPDAQSAASAQAQGATAAGLLVQAQRRVTLTGGIEDQAAPPAPARTPPPPPLAEGPTSGQAPAMPSLPRDAPGSLAAHHLLQQTSAALARQQLLQLASLPRNGQGPRWMFEIPLITPQGSAVAQFQVSGERRDRSADGEPSESLWRVKFSLDIEPLGPVHAQALLGPGRAGVTIWAERPSSAEMLRRQEGSLTGALKSAGFDPDVAVYAGAPRAEAPPAPGRLLDQAS
jgi:hypothetical protein